MLIALKKQSGVYEIVNNVNGKKYVGVANDLVNRFSVHRTRLRKGVSHSRVLQNAWNKYGEQSFTFKPLIICSKEDAAMYETKLIGSGDYVYNVAITPVSGRPKGSKTSDEGRRNMSICRIGKKPSDETRAKLSAARKAWWAKKESDPVEVDRHLNRPLKGAFKIVKAPLVTKRVIYVTK